MLLFMFLRYLIEQGAHVGAVNSEGELPLDVATEDAMERLLKEEIQKQGEKPAGLDCCSNICLIHFCICGFRWSSGTRDESCSFSVPALLRPFRGRCGQGQEGRGAGHAPGRHRRAGRRGHAHAAPQHQGHRSARRLGQRLHRSPEVRISLQGWNV